MTTFEKYERDGLVAVLYSPGFGAGWYTWNRDSGQGMIFDRELVQAVLDGDRDRAMEIAKSKYPDAYLGGGKDLEITWLPIGTKFYINEYDGSESIKLIEDLELTA